MAEETNPLKRTLDDIDEIGRYFVILLAVAPSIGGALQNQKISSVWGLLGLTAPFTAAVAVQTYFFLRRSFKHAVSYLVSAWGLLLALSLVSRLIGLGSAIDVGNVLEQHLTDPVLPIFKYVPLGDLLTTLWRCVEDYFELYKPVAFCLALVCGIYLGYRFAKADEKKELAASDLKKAAAAG